MNAKRKKKKPQPLSQDSESNSASNKEIIAIDKLLNAAAELMNKTPGIDQEAYEFLRQLRVKVRFAMSAEASPNWGHPPSKAPAKWSERKNKDESPIEFIKREYGPWIEQKSISRADIRRLDRQLYVALYNWMSKHGDISSMLDLPTLSTANERKLSVAGPQIRAPSHTIRIAELPLEAKEQLRLYKLAKRHKRLKSE